MPLDHLAQPIRTLVFLGMLLPSLSVSVAAFLAHKDYERIQRSFAWVARCQRIDELVQKVVADVIEMEAGQRGYLLTGRTSYLKPFDNARTRVFVDLVDLRVLVRQTPDQRDRVDCIDGLVSDKLEVAAQTIALENVGQHAAAVRMVRADESKKTTDYIHDLADEISREQEELVKVPQADLAERAQNHARVLFTLLALNTVSIGCILLLLRSLGRLRSLVRMCAWSRTVEFEGEWLSFEKYLERRFNVDITHGISPKEAEKLVHGSIKNSLSSRADRPATSKDQKV